MEAHPRAPLVHVLLEGRVLAGAGLVVQEQDHLVFGEGGRVQVAPVLGRIVGEPVLLTHLGKPFVGLVREAYMGHVVIGGEESYHLEFRGHHLGGGSGNQNEGRQSGKKSLDEGTKALDA